MYFSIAGKRMAAIVDLQDAKKCRTIRCLIPLFLTRRMPALDRASILASMYHAWYTFLVGKKLKSPTGIDAQPDALEKQGKRVPAIFFRTEAGGEPVRNWLKGLPLPDDRKRIGEDIKTVEFGWPIGMPVCKSLGDGLYEVRTSLAQHRIARVLFYIDRKGRMVLLHGFVKKTPKTPDEDMELARSNRKKHQRGLQ
jgi:phage-related protein